MADCIREQLERNEELILSPRATLSKNTRGREVPEPESELRTAFQRDRDRIIHSSAFRRLKHKTQVFLSPEGDHYRTRLTHTLEVSQIARTIAKALGLNEDLTEAVALGHDIGHTPFGHAGERAIGEITGKPFYHYEQSVRVCKRLEKGGKGLNLTAEVLDGIDRHTKGTLAFTLEGQIVRYADHIAYINHDIDDAVRAGVLKESDIPEEYRKILGGDKSARINTMVMSVVNSSTDMIKMDEPVNSAYEGINKFLFEKVYTNPECKSEESKVKGIIEGLFDYYISHPEKITGEYMKVAEEEGRERAVIDLVAGMTDTYALERYKEIYIPKSWNI